MDGRGVVRLIAVLLVPVSIWIIRRSRREEATMSDFYVYLSLGGVWGLSLGLLGGYSIFSFVFIPVGVIAALIFYFFPPWEWF